MPIKDLIAMQQTYKNPNIYYNPDGVRLDVFCVYCNRVPEDIPEFNKEYIESVAGEVITPTEFIIDYDGTYNSDNGHFCCTECYIKIGMPSSSYGWVAP